MSKTPFILKIPQKTLMTKYLLLFLMFALFLTNCEINSYPGDALANKITFEVGRQLAKKYPISISGIGGGCGQQEGKIGRLTIFFSRTGPYLTQEEARALIIDCTQEFLAAINASTELRKYLDKHPFTAKDISIAIMNKEKNDDFVFHPNFDTIAQFSGTICYYTRDPENPLSGYKSEIEETYEEALTILNNQNNEKTLIKTLISQSYEEEFQNEKNRVNGFIHSSN